MGAQPQPAGAGVAPLGFAIGIAVLLVGLIVSPLVIAPLGGAITLAAGFVWVRRGNAWTGPSIAPSVETTELYPIDAPS